MPQKPSLMAKTFFKCSSCAGTSHGAGRRNDGSVPWTNARSTALLPAGLDGQALARSPAGKPRIPHLILNERQTVDSRLIGRGRMETLRLNPGLSSF